MNLLYLLIAILKFTGITLLIITLVLLVLISLILVVPIEYQLYFNKQDTIYVKTYIKWLYSIIGIEIVYDNKKVTSHSIKLFGKRIFSFKDKKAIQKEKTKKKKPVKKRKKPVKKTKNNKSKKTKTKFKDTLKRITDFHYKKELLTDTISWIKKVFKEIMPSKLYVDLEIGKDDPADTGELMGRLAILFPFYYSVINIKGNYEKKCFYGILDVSGNITLGRVVYDFIQYIRTQSVKQMIRFIRKNRREKKDERKVTN